MYVCVWFLGDCPPSPGGVDVEAQGKHLFTLRAPLSDALRSLKEEERAFCFADSTDRAEVRAKQLANHLSEHTAKDKWTREQPRSSPVARTHGESRPRPMVCKERVGLAPHWACHSLLSAVGLRVASFKDFKGGLDAGLIPWQAGVILAELCPLFSSTFSCCLLSLSRTDSDSSARVDFPPQTESNGEDSSRPR